MDSTVNTSSGGSTASFTSDAFTDLSYDQISLRSNSITSSSLMKDHLTLSCNTHRWKYSRVSVLGIRQKYSFLQHAVYSILIGRTLVIMGEEKNKKRVKCLVYGLANFLPYSKNCMVALPWLNTPLSLNQLGRLGIVGLLKNSKGNTVQNSLKPYVSILDYEEETLVAPRYSGKFLSEMFQHTQFLSEAAYRQYILQLFADLASQVFIHFVIGLRHSGRKVNASITSELNIQQEPQQHQQQQQQHEKREIKGDEAIIVGFIRRMRDDILQKQSSGDKFLPRSTVKLNNMKCVSFTNTTKKRR